MPVARTAPLRSRDAGSGKLGFAKRALGFAKRAAPKRRPAGFPWIAIGCLCAAGLMIVTGGFGTGDLPLARRAGFWLLLMGWNAVKWQAWFALTVRRPADWPRASLIGTPLLNLPLPVEIALCGAAVRAPMVFDPLETWGRALAISAVIFLTVSLVAWALLRKPKPTPAAITADGLLARARIADDAVTAVEAEDHYCRVHARDGRSVLIHYRFGDALQELAGLDGAQVHRGAWVSASAVEGADRDGRRWRLRLVDGSHFRVSASHLPRVRALGWLSRG